MTTVIVFASIGVVVLLIAMYIRPEAVGRRAIARRKKREMAELRSRVMVNARRTYDKQFPRSSGHGGSRSRSSYYDGGSSSFGFDSGGSSCDSGGGSGGDSGGGGGDGGGGGC